ncbi:hypothetical protein C0431_00710 [bacterium]|nr:hypothetical protein [bacterium]
MFAALPFTLALITSPQSGWETKSNTTKIPFEVHNAVVKALQEATEAQTKRDYQLSLALLHGIIYNDGVKIAIDPDGLTPTPAARQGLTNALNSWEKALEKDNPIQFISDPTKAHLTLQFVDKVPRSGHDALGLIELKKRYSWNRTRYEIEISGTIYVQTHFNRIPLTSSQFTEVIAHELGHLLGLDDLNQTGQLMGPMILDQPVSGPNARETYAVQIVRYHAKTQWNTVVDLINASKQSQTEAEFLSYEQEYLATCTVGGPCKYGKH